MHIIKSSTSIKKIILHVYEYVYAVVRTQVSTSSKS